MNRQMWAHAATQRSLAQLRADGVALRDPNVGEMACGARGEGRMLEVSGLFAAVVASAQPKVLAGKRVGVTAGPTFEALDPVRGITKSSSGKMGFALGEAGAHVLVVAGRAESQDVERLGAEKRRKKKVPLIVANRAQDALGSEENEVSLLSDQGITRLTRMRKLALARTLVSEIAQRQ